jgi:putative transposase
LIRIETGLRDRVREFIQAMFEGELEAALSRPRYARSVRPLSGDGEGAVCVSGHRHGHRSRSLLGSFGQLKIEVPRARLNTADGKTTEWKSQALRAYQRRTLVADALIAGNLPRRHQYAPCDRGLTGRQPLCPLRVRRCRASRNTN